MAHRTLAGPLSWLFAGLVVYASLFPFAGWRFQGGDVWAFLLASWPRYWTWFDLLANFLGYVPLGFLLALRAVRALLPRRGILWAFLAPGLLSLSLETLQVFLPGRVPSNVDLVLNVLGGCAGASLALTLARLGWLLRWSQFRERCFTPDAHGALVLLALWPVALLYPVSVPFGLGQVWERVLKGLEGLVAGSTLAVWWPQHVPVSVPLSPLGEAGVVALGLLAPVLLGYSVLRGGLRRALWWGLVGLVGTGVVALSAALTHGPGHAWGWMTPRVGAGVVLGMALGGALMGLTRRTCVVALLVVVVAGVSVLNGVIDAPYLDDSIGAWAAGRFIRFHGLTQWVGWAWPYAVLFHALAQATRRPAGSASEHPNF